MHENEVRILEMLQEGFSYAKIQESLQVSSKTIAAIKKAHFPIAKSAINVLSNDTFHTLSNPEPVKRQAPIIDSYPYQQPNNHFSNTQKRKTMNHYDEDEEDTPLSQLEVAKLKLELAHELEMKKLETMREERERELDLKEQELQLKKDELSIHSNKKEDEKRTLLFRIKKIAEACVDGEYSFDEADSLLTEAKQVLSQCDQYCFVNGINFSVTDSHTLLTNIITTLEEFLDGFDDDDDEDVVGDLEFGHSHLKLFARMKFNSF